MQCTNNLKQLGLALHNYNDVHKVFPYRKGGTNGTFNGNERWNHNSTRLSGFVAMLPFMEQSAMSQAIATGDPNGTIWNTPPGNYGGAPRAAPGGPCAWCGWLAWIRSPGYLRCPSDPSVFNQSGNTQQNNYAFCSGDMVNNVLNTPTASPPRGVFGGANIHSSLAEIKDGTSNTVVFSERLKANYAPFVVTAGQIDVRVGTAVGIANIVNAPMLCRTAAAGKTFAAGRTVKGRFGSLWTDGQAERVAFTTVLPPNAPGCTDDTNVNADSVNIVLPASSSHPGGVNCAMGDGSVRFISETIDTGNTGVPQPSTGFSMYGVWGSLGSKAGGDVASLD
jgi:prepilin-type processing-associated H-X9-DG protein